MAECNFTVYIDSQAFNVKMKRESTCGELLAKVRSLYAETFKKPGSHVLGLKSLQGFEVLDSWLTKLDKPIPSLPSSRNSLSVIIEPTPGDSMMQNLKFADFEFEKCIGKGGTSEVFLGLKNF